MEIQFHTTDPLVEMDQKTIWHPFTQMRTAPAPIPIARAKGVSLYTPEGKRYLDAISSWWTNLHGHAHPYIVERIKSQAETLEHVMFAHFTHAPAVELATRLLEVLPKNLSRVFYSDNGSTAAEIALKMAIQYWYNQDAKTSRTKVVCFKNGYHGDTFGAMSASGKNPLNRPFWKHLFHVEPIDIPLKGQEEASLAMLESILEKNDTACFIFEPLVLGTGGMVIYPAEGLNRLIQCCKRHGVLTIADEAMTGFGRTGSLFASAQLSEPPDIICLAKGLSGGFLPLAATVCTEKIYNAFLGDSMNQALLHGHTFTANPIACSCALASLDLLLDNSCTEQRNRIAASHQIFCRQWKDHPRLKRCESLGTILSLEYAEETSYFSSTGNRLSRFFLDRGILLRPLGNVLYVIPPYCIQQDELEFIYAQIAETIEEAI